MKRALITLPILALVGCDPLPTEKWATDQAKRQELFKQCLAALPAGPKSTHYNDWDEVVGACDRAAYWQSRYCYENCPTPPTVQKDEGE